MKCKSVYLCKFFFNWRFAVTLWGYFMIDWEKNVVGSLDERETHVMIDNEKKLANNVNVTLDFFNICLIVVWDLIQ